ncbi:aromatic ring-hydroxylating dioxygenase subunit alpha [Rhizobium sp. 2YAF20]|uniref:aromatic ring-hydroxylating oxygenase subunit alpha n=1 Tax=Rhizobium sp. 2YAF20 TaxID=3233027 RepID=UPI003F97FD21
MLDKPNRNFLANNSSPIGNTIAKLIANQPGDYSLQQAFYTSPEIYRFEIDNVLMKHWHCVGHQSQIAEAGQYLVYDIDKESIIVTRAQDGEIYAMSNVCRHRGSRICDGSGKAEGNTLVCPYHAWSYGLDGSLQHARMMPRNFDKASHGLTRLPVRVAQGLILVSLSESPLEIDTAIQTVDGIYGNYDWANAKVIHQNKITFKANWKLALENQVECMHCGPAHPEFSDLHGMGLPNEAQLRQELVERTKALDLNFVCNDLWALNAPEGHEMTFADRVPMKPGVLSATSDGNPVAPIMGNLPAHDGAFSLYYVGPHNHFITYSDYGGMFCYSPKSADETTLTFTWLVRGDAKEGVDYHREKVTWLWDVTSAADKKIVEDNHLGVLSRFYNPGPYALPIEYKTARFTKWYLEAMMRAVETLPAEDAA